MANQYYLKDKKISLWDCTTETVKGVTKKVYYARARKVWAYYRHNGGNATITGSSLKVYDENAAALFVTNKREMKATDLVIYKHKIYEVTRIDDYEGYNDDIKILCKLATNQNFSSYTGLEDD